MRYRILGTTQAIRPDGTPVAVGGARLRALLTVLALRAGRSVPAGLLTEEVWAGDPPADAPGALQALVGRLRRALGAGAIESAEGGYRLAATPEDVDLHRFERLTGDGVRALADDDPAKAAVLLDDALALWHGPALADLPDRTADAARWEARRLDALRARHTAAIALGQAEQALPELTALCDAHPLDEPLQALRLRALRDAGRTAQALVAYDAVRRLLADRLGTDPGPELRALHAELLSPDDDPAGPAQTPSAPRAPQAPHPPQPSQSPPPGNLRARLTSFVGREDDIEAIRGDLASARLVTLLGPGGAGKTRLSQEAAETVRDTASDTARDGVWLAELAPVADPDAVPQAVLTAVGARETVLYGAGAEEMRAVADRNDDPVERLVEHCARRRMLIILDNCEHVVEAAARLVEELLARCPHVTVLATSREPLGVPGELLRPLDPLPEPVALRLLADRGAAARPGFRTEDDPEACAEICSRLDGLPLAIELAAARLRMLTPRQIADRLDDRFRLLTNGSRTVLPRQQTLRAVVDWSWDLLDEDERDVLARLSVFARGCDLAAVEAVCGPPPVQHTPDTHEPAAVRDARDGGDSGQDREAGGGGDTGSGGDARSVGDVGGVGDVGLGRDGGSSRGARGGWDTGSGWDARSGGNAGGVGDVGLGRDGGSSRDARSGRGTGSGWDARSGGNAGGVGDVGLGRDGGSSRDARSGRDAGSGWDARSGGNAGGVGDGGSSRDARSGRDTGSGWDARSGRDADSGWGGGSVLGARGRPPARSALDSLASLVDKSLVVAAPAPDGDMRYRLLETVAEYAGERLDESGRRAAAERAHLVHYRELARTTEPLLRGPGQRAAIDRFQLEYENLRTALRRAVAARDEQEALSLTLSLVWYWQMRDLRIEAGSWCQEVMALGPDPFTEPLRRAAPVWQPLTAAPPPLTGEALAEARRGVHLTHLACMETELDTWQTPAAQAKMRLIAETYEPGLPQTCRVPGLYWFFAVMMTDLGRIRTIVDANVDTCRRTPGHEWELAACLQMRANILANRADWAENAFRDADECLEIFRRLGDDWGTAEALSARAEAHERVGAYRKAADDYQDAMEYAERLGARAQSAVLAARLGSVLVEVGEEERAERLLRGVVDGPDHAGTEAVPAARLFLAGWLGISGRRVEAREQLRLLRADFTRGRGILFDAFILSAEACLDAIDDRDEEALPRIRVALERATDPLPIAVAPHLRSFYLFIAATALGGVDDGSRAADGARCLGAADRLQPPRHVSPRMEREVRDLAVARIRAALSERDFETAYAEGGGLSYEEAAALV